MTAVDQQAEFHVDRECVFCQVRTRKEKPLAVGGNALDVQFANRSAVSLASLLVGPVVQAGT